MDRLAVVLILDINAPLCTIQYQRIDVAFLPLADMQSSNAFYEFLSCE